MTSEKQIEANRRNAQKSTGPKTEQGKSTVAQNAIKHGLRSNRVLITSDNPAEFAKHHKALFKELAPVGPMEIFLTKRIIALTWQLIRAACFQACTFNTLIDKEDQSAQQEHGEEKKDSLYYLRVDVLEKAGISEQEYDEITEKKGYEELERIVDQRLRERQLVEQGEEDSDQCAEKMLGLAIYTDFSQSRALERLTMYERRIENSLYRTQLQLERLQLRRQQKEAEKQRANLRPTKNDKQTQFQYQQHSRKRLSHKYILINSG